jgi:starch synthase
VKYKNGNGIRFAEADSPSITKAITRAINLFNNKGRLNKAISNAFDSDFSWDASAENYINLYQELIKR